MSDRPPPSTPTQSARTDLGAHRAAGPGAALFTLLVILAGLWVGHSARLTPAPGSREALLIDDLFRTMLGIAVGVFLLVLGALLYAVLRFRRRPGHQGEGVPIRGSDRLELAWTFMPALIVFWLAAYSAQVLAQIHAPAESPRIVEVRARQFVWQFTYPEEGITVPELHVPAGSPVRLELSSEDVIHSLWVPAFRLKQDALPQTVTSMSFTAVRPGEYPILCAELCGAGHAVMLSRVVVHDPADFARWLEEQG